MIDRILHQNELFGHPHTLMQLTDGVMPHAQVMRVIELLGTVIAPAVRAESRGGRRGRTSRSRREERRTRSKLHRNPVCRGDL